MSSRKTGILIFLSSLLLIAAIVYFIVFYEPSEKVEVVIVPNDVSVVSNIDIVNNKEEADLANISKQASNIPRKDMVQADADRVASSFIERYGTYSNQAKQANLIDLKIFMTKQMQQWTDNNIKNSLNNIEEYSGQYSVVTRAVNAEVISGDVESSEVMVYTSRKETKEGEELRAFNQEALVELVKDGNRWKVNGVYWQ